MPVRSHHDRRLESDLYLDLDDRYLSLFIGSLLYFIADALKWWPLRIPSSGSFARQLDRRANRKWPLRHPRQAYAAQLDGLLVAFAHWLDVFEQPRVSTGSAKLDVLIYFSLGSRYGYLPRVVKEDRAGFPINGPNERITTVAMRMAAKCPGRRRMVLPPS